jgi:hypothetical protein
MNRTSLGNLAIGEKDTGPVLTHSESIFPFEVAFANFSVSAIEVTGHPVYVCGINIKR